jgi:hypothetical protein
MLALVAAAVLLVLILLCTFGPHGTAGPKGPVGPVVPVGPVGPVGPLGPMLTVVCNTPHTPDRTAHMRRVCEEEGLVPYSLTTELGLFVDKSSEECARTNALFNTKGVSPVYAAHYMTYLAVLRYFISRPEFGLLLVLEDDIKRAEGSTVTVQGAIADAPPFELLFLEYCFAECSRPTWSNSRYARGYDASCTGACVFTRRGAFDLLAFAGQHSPMVIDHLTPMYSNLYSNDVLYITPALFKQDVRVFGSSVVDQSHDRPTCR